ncbi:uncharacterized protein PADG_06581 [Paracoccidioides brasiliensis Pb18]|uniref:PiggyBac transposable element-derived protein domain-containing protein n=1 Tax=Paracoccidioides brasiliensis (strain Pb18) TaxID=502780 RepID=C1GH45_PARBD|nr:uncharacterized protein PADG_06581 [Paracoccidioides brasiliensis Pb18]EEH50502.2 hypothetical protein PADG_06581 [Paracoccidioides brasiliensis Pb18]
MSQPIGSRTILYGLLLVTTDPHFRDFRNQSKFLPLEPSSRLPNLHIPPDVGVQSPYALFTLFFSEDSIHNIVNSTNLYAKLKGDDGDTDNEAPESFGKDKKKDKEEEIPMEASAEPSIFMETSKELKTSIQQHPLEKNTSEEIKVF